MANNLHCLFCPVQAEIANHAQHVEYESHGFVLYCVDNVAVMLCVKKVVSKGKKFSNWEKILREREREALKICSRGRSGSRINIAFVKETYLLYK